MMDRRKKDELPKMQVGFIDFVCMPLYKVLADLIPPLEPLHDGVKTNRSNWQLLADDPKGAVEHCSCEFLQLLKLFSNYSWISFPRVLHRDIIPQQQCGPQ